MKQFTYQITSPCGLHGRPATGLVEAARDLSSAVTVEKAGGSADATRLMALMLLGVDQGDTVTVTVEGGDEETSLAVLERFFQENL